MALYRRGVSHGNASRMYSSFKVRTTGHFSYFPLLPLEVRQQHFGWLHSGFSCLVSRKELFQHLHKICIPVRNLAAGKSYLFQVAELLISLQPAWVMSPQSMWIRVFKGGWDSNMTRNINWACLAKNLVHLKEVTEHWTALEHHRITVWAILPVLSCELKILAMFTSG